MKKLIALLLAVVMVLGLAACSVSEKPATETPAAETPAAETPATETPAAETPAAEEAAPVAISLWTYPIGDWGDQATVDSLLAAFNAKYPNISVTVEYLTYQDGDDKVNTAIEGNAAPDLVMEGPERLVANWGAKGKMVDLSDLWTDDVIADTNAAVTAACQATNGAYYEYPLCMTAHCMAINKTVFEAAGAMQYIDEDSHTWTTEGFIQAVEAVYNAGYENVGVVFCGGQGGDQGNRALINNLYGGTFTNAEHTQYTANSPENIKALETLRDLDGITFDPSIVGGDEINLFRQGQLQMATCWNIGQQLIGDHTDSGDEIMFLAFPSENGTDSKLCGGIWGFGIFDNGDAAKIEAAKTFINYICNEEPAASVAASNYFPVKASVTGVYTGTETETLMNEYNKLMGLLGDYYQVVPGWATARTEWWNMLQRIGTGADVAAEVATFDANANAAAAAEG